jgi:hypothetical protein
VWTLTNGQLEGVTVAAGLTDGQFTEVAGDVLRPGTVLVTNVSTAAQPTRTPGANLFMPGFGPGGPPSGGRQGSPATGSGRGG